MKKTILLILFSLLNVLIVQAHDFKKGGICYNLIAGTDQVEVTTTNGTWFEIEYSGSVVIPATVKYRGNIYRVTSIGEHAFYRCSGLTSVTIPESVTSIGANAFSYSGLTSVEWNAVTYQDIDYSGHPFQGCNITSITFGSQVEHIPAYLCYRMNKLTTVTIPNSVTTIGDHAFEGCSGLTSVTILNSVTSIGKSAFKGCSGLTSVTIPNSVTSIGAGAFYECRGLTSVTIPNSVTTIGSSAFEGCRGLTTVTIPNRVTSVESSAFEGCTGLKSVTIPNSVTIIGFYAFKGCTGLTSVTIPNSVTTIGSSAFEGCRGLTTVTIPESVTFIWDEAFSGCSGLTSVKWKSVARQKFDYSGRPFQGCKNITSITFGNQVKHIPAYLCYGMNKLTSVTIPNSVTTIGSSAFEGCTGLKSVTIPNSVTSIGENAFKGCTGLTSETIPESMTKDVESELWEYFYQFATSCVYFRSPDANAAMTMVTEYGAGIDILTEVSSIVPRMKTKESFLAYLNSGGEMKTITKTETPFYIDEERSAIVGVYPTSREHILFILPSGSGLTKWTEGVEEETYTCTAVFTDISFWKDGEKLHRKAVKITKSTRLDNGKEVKEWSYWVKGLSKLATYGYWGDPNEIGCIERSLKIDNKPIIEVSKK